MVLQAFLRKLWADITATLGPHLKAGSRSLEQGMRSVRRQLHELTAHPQVSMVDMSACQHLCASC